MLPTIQSRSRRSSAASDKAPLWIKRDRNPWKLIPFEGVPGSSARKLSDPPVLATRPAAPWKPSNTETPSPQNVMQRPSHATLYEAHRSKLYRRFAHRFHPPRNQRSSSPPQTKRPYSYPVQPLPTNSRDIRLPNSNLLPTRYEYRQCTYPYSPEINLRAKILRGALLLGDAMIFTNGFMKIRMIIMIHRSLYACIPLTKRNNRELERIRIYLPSAI